MSKLVRFLIIILSCVAGQTTSASGVLDNASLTSQLTQLQQTVSDVQSQSQAMEQKYAAVLSNVLSTLSSNKDDLAALEAQVNASISSINAKLTTLEGNVNATLTSTNAKLAAIESQLNNSTVSNMNELSLVKAKTNTSISSLDKDLENIKHELNSTISSNSHLITKTKTQLNARITSNVHKLTVGQSKLNDTVMDNQVHIESIQAQQRSTELSLRQLTVLYQGFKQHGNILVGRELKQKRLSIDMNEDVAFEASQLLHDGVLESSNVTFNAGEGYDAKTGIFTAPLTGTFLFWTHVVGESVRSIQLMVNDTAAGIAYGSVCQRTDQDPIRCTGDAVNGVLVTSLSKHDHVTFRISSAAGLNRSCTVGGILIHPHFQK